MGVLNWVFGSTPGGVVAEGTHAAITGVIEGVKDIIEEFHLPPEQAMQGKLRLAEIQLKAFEDRISDIQSARQMQMAVRSPWPGIITFTMLVGFFGVMILIIFKGLPSTTEAGGQAIMLLIGALTTGLGTAIHFWLGANKDDQTRAEMLANSVPASAIPKP